MFYTPGFDTFMIFFKFYFLCEDDLFLKLFHRRYFLCPDGQRKSRSQMGKDFESPLAHLLANVIQVLDSANYYIP